MAQSPAPSFRNLRLCLFDLDYTLIRLTLDPIGAHVDLLQAAGRTFPRPRVRIAYDDAWDDYLQAGFRHPTQAAAYLNVVRHAMSLLHVDDPDDTLARRIDDRINDVAAMCAYDDSVPVLEAVRRAGLEIGLATGRWHDPAPDLAALQLTSCLDRTYYSGQFGHQKDDPAFWDALIADAGRPPSEILLIDDSLQSVRTALAAGLCALTIRRPGSPLPPFPNPDLRSLTELLPLLGLSESSNEPAHEPTPPPDLS